jgi:hypothetical protein
MVGPIIEAVIIIAFSRDLKVSVESCLIENPIFAIAFRENFVTFPKIF